MRTMLPRNDKCGIYYSFFNFVLWYDSESNCWYMWKWNLSIFIKYLIFISLILTAICPIKKWYNDNIDGLAFVYKK